MRHSLLALAAALLQLCSAAFVQLPASRRWASAHRSYPSPASRSTTSLTLRADLGIEDSSLAPIVAPAAASAPHWLQKPVAIACVGLLLVFLAPSSAHATTFADSSFVQAGSLIFVSEIGDKTFFIATLLAARASRLLTFAGCAGALAFMTIVSVAIGQIFHAVPASITRGLPLDDYVAVASFVYFGVKSIVDAIAIEDGEDGAGIAEEREEAESTLAEKGSDRKTGWPLVVEACTLTVVAE